MGYGYCFLKFFTTLIYQCKLSVILEAGTIFQKFHSPEKKLVCPLYIHEILVLNPAIVNFAVLCFMRPGGKTYLFSL